MHLFGNRFLLQAAQRSEANSGVSHWGRVMVRCDVGTVTSSFGLQAFYVAICCLRLVSGLEKRLKRLKRPTFHWTTAVVATKSKGTVGDVNCTWCTWWLMFSGASTAFTIHRHLSLVCKRRLTGFDWPSPRLYFIFLIMLHCGIPLLNK